MFTHGGTPLWGRRNLDGLNRMRQGRNSGRIPRWSTSIASPRDPGQLRHSRLHAAARRCSMRNDDRDKTRSDMGNMGSMSDHDRNTDMGSDSSSDFGDES